MSKILKFKSAEVKEIRAKLIRASQDPGELSMSAIKILFNTAASTITSLGILYDNLLEAARDQVLNYGMARIWLPIEVAKKDGNPIWAVLRPDLGQLGSPIKTHNPTVAQKWAGSQIPLVHAGTPNYVADGEDTWEIAFPGWSGGRVPESWIYGWVPMPKSPVYVHPDDEAATV